MSFILASVTLRSQVFLLSVDHVLLKINNSGNYPSLYLYINLDWDLFSMFRMSTKFC